MMCEKCPNTCNMEFPKSISKCNWINEVELSNDTS